MPEPLITKPAIRMLPPVPTVARDERLMIRLGFAAPDWTTTPPVPVRTKEPFPRTTPSSRAKVPES
jgi:hypothetical protein